MEEPIICKPVNSNAFSNYTDSQLIKSDSKEQLATLVSPTLSKIQEEHSEHEQSLFVQNMNKIPSFVSQTPSGADDILASVVKKISSNRDLDATLGDDNTTGSSRRYARLEKRAAGQ